MTDALVERLVADPSAPLPALDEAAALAIAWQLKSRCYEAWHAEPAVAGRAAEALRRLAQDAAADQPSGGPAADAGRPGSAGAELAALADWCDAIAALIRGEMAAAVERLDSAAALWHRLGRPHEAAQTQVPKIMALSILGRFDDAEACAADAAAALQAAGDTTAAAKVLLNRGSLAMQRAAFAQAIQPYREAAALFARAGDRAHSVMADIGLADACAMLGRFDEAAPLYERARQRAARHGLQVLEASACDGQATLALSRGQPAAALAGLEAARRAWQALDLPQLQAEAERSLADAYLEVRLLPEAIALYEDLLARPDADEAGATRPWTWVQLGRARALSGDPAAALAALDEAAGVFGAESIAVGLATVELARAELQLAAGDAAGAREHAAGAVAGFDEEGAAVDADRARALAAAAARAAGDAAAAEAACDALLARGDLAATLRVRVEVERALAWRARGRQEDARAALERAIDEIELIHDTLPGDDLRRAFLDDGATAHIERLRMALDGRPADADAEPVVDAAEVLGWLDRLKDRAVAQQLGHAGLDAPAGHPDEPEDDETVELRARLDAIQRRRRRLTEDDEAPSPGLDDEALRLERELLERGRRARLLAAARPANGDGHDGTRRAPERAPGPAGPGLAEALRRRLAADEALVAYGRLDDELLAVVVTAAGPRLVRRLADAPRLQRAVDSLHFQLESMRPGDAALGAHAGQLQERVRAHLARLHDLVWAPLAGALGGATRITVVPHDALHRLPFAALESPAGPLVEHLELAIARNAHRLLAAAPDAAPPEAPAVLLGDVQALPQVAGELDAVAGALGGRARRVDDFAAWRGACGDAGVLHLACHADFRPDSPLHSALHVGDASLTAADVGRLRLARTRLVVLSACETGAGLTGSRVDASLGLTRAFLLSGAQRVLASQWRVDDGSTATLMAAFHRRWPACGRAAAALREAQFAVRRHHPHPFHWAAFQLHL